MIIAHLPAGYVLARLMRVPTGPVFAATLLGSVFPDFDMFWFHLVDDRAFHHHRYWVHAPGFWLILAAVVLPLLRVFAPRALPAALMFLLAVLIHLVLDTLVGSIMWLWPFSTELYQLAEVPATQSHWVLSFMVHWSFMAEIGIILWAPKFALISFPIRSAPGAMSARPTSTGRWKRIPTTPLPSNGIPSS